MIAKVTRCWDSPPRLTVILQEKGATKETQAFLWSDSQVLQAQLALDCERKERYFAVQLAPPDRFGHHHIERFEMIHEPRDLKAETDALLNESETAESLGAQEDHRVDEERYRNDRAHGMTRRILQ